MTLRLETKTSQGWRNDDGTTIAPHTLYRFASDTDKPGCWYASPANAITSWLRKHPEDAHAIATLRADD